MKQSKMISLICILFLGLTFTSGVAGIKIASASDPETFACVGDDQLEKEIAPEAALEEFACFFKKWNRSETLHFTVTVKNVSDTPQRYRVNIFLDNGKGVGGLLPRKTKKGLVEPGQTSGFVYPVKGMAGKPQSVFLKISTMSQ